LLNFNQSFIVATKALFNSVVNWFIGKRIDQMKHFIDYPYETQQGVLFSQLFMAEDTEYGKKYGFKSIHSIEDFQNKVPIVSYEDFEPYIERVRKGEPNIIWKGSIKNFAKSSGTTNAKSKFIPITDASLEDCHYKAGKDLISIYVNNHPDSELFQHKNLRLGGSCEISQSLGSKFGDLSAILIENLPYWVEIINTPSKKVSLMGEWESKLQAIINEVKEQDVGSLTGVPSWMMVLLQKLLKESDCKSISQIWPNIEVFFHGGISFVPYREQYKKIINKNINYYEIYNASEGFFGIQDRSDADDMLLMLDYGIFYEFIPMDEFNKSDSPKTVTLEDVEVDKNYALVITTNGGLWRYLIGDTVKFTSTNPHRIKISGRTKHYINAFGEELMIDNVENALKRACELTNSDIVDYTGAPIYMDNGESGAHEWLIEFGNEPSDMNAFTKIFDETLKSHNSDYEAKRYKNITLKQPVIHKAHKKLFYDWMNSRDKLGGQNKVPRLSNDREFINPLLKMNKH